MQCQIKTVLDFELLLFFERIFTTGLEFDSLTIMQQNWQNIVFLHKKDLL